MKKYLTISALAACASVVLAQTDAVWFHFSNGVKFGGPASKVASVKYAGDDGSLLVSFDGEPVTVLPDGFEKMTFGTTDGAVHIDFGSEGIAVENPRGLTDVDCEVASPGHVVVNALGTSPVEIRVTGSVADGQVRVYGDAPVRLVLDNATLANLSGAPVSLQTTAGAEVVLLGANTLKDLASKYTVPSGESEKGVLHSRSALVFSGSGSLTASSICKHVICCDESVTVNGGELSLLSSASDAIHCEGFRMTAGKVLTAESAGDGIDAGAGTLSVSGGQIDVAIAEPDTKGLKADGDITISGGDITLRIDSEQGKGIKTKADMTVTGGSVTSVATGDAVVTDGDPSYCTTVKVDGNLTVSGGSFNIKSSGMGGKGISVDGDTTISGGSFEITCSGNGAKYTDASGTADAYSSTCITVDGNLSLLAGKFTLANSGTAGKCVKADGDLLIGDQNAGPEITAKTSGAKILVSGSSSSGWGGMGGGMDSGDYSNPKVIKAQGNLTVNNGSLALTSTADGGEALESKATLTINGGDINISTVDDCINAAKHLQINGGVVRCLASNNDAIDSNGTITIAGGVTIACGATQPECGIDCDNYTFKITGGVLVGMGGDTSTPTASSCTQRSLIYSTSMPLGTMITIVDPSGNHVVSFTSPKTLSGNAKLLISAPGITTGTHTVYKAGTLSGGTSSYEVTVGGSYTPGSQLTTFSPSSMVTNLGGSSSGGGGRPW